MSAATWEAFVLGPREDLSHALTLALMAAVDTLVDDTRLPVDRTLDLVKQLTSAYYNGDVDPTRSGTARRILQHEGNLITGTARIALLQLDRIEELLRLCDDGGEPNDTEEHHRN